MLLELKFPFVNSVPVTLVFFSCADLCSQIFSHASPKAVVPPGYAEKIKQSEIGLLSTWSPQQLIFDHPVSAKSSITRIFSKAFFSLRLLDGFSRTVGRTASPRRWHREYQCTCVPSELRLLVYCFHLILFPFHFFRIACPLFADQPINAAYLTLNLDVAFEIFEVRTGPGLRPLHRGVRPTGTIEAITAEARNVLERARGPEGERKRRNAQAMRHKWKKEWEEGGDALINLRKFLTDNCSGN